MSMPKAGRTGYSVHDKASPSLAPLSLAEPVTRGRPGLHT